jgi:hypothetical protein
MHLGISPEKNLKKWYYKITTKDQKTNWTHQPCNQNFQQLWDRGIPSTHLFHDAPKDAWNKTQTRLGFVYSECVTSKLLWTDQTPNQRSASKMYTCTRAELHLTNGTKPNQTLLISRVDIVHVCPPVLKTWTHRGLLSSTASGSIPTHAEYHAYEHPLVMCVIFHPHVEDWERSLVHSGFQGSP